MSVAQTLSANCITTSHENCEVNCNDTLLKDKIVPISVKSDFPTFFKDKFVTITGIHREFTAPIHEILHYYGTLYEYEEGCEVVIIVGKETNEKRIRTLLRKYPDATLLEYNKELSDFVNCDYKSAITLEYKHNNLYKDESNKEDKYSTKKIIGGFFAILATCAIAYVSLGFLILLIIFVPGATKLISKNLFK